MIGIYSINKPVGPTSNDVVKKIKEITGEKKVGHAGTLDPLAEGVLVVAVGRDATKQLRYVLEEDKEYLAEMKLGMTSTTDDEEGEKKTIKVEKEPTKKEVERAASKFLGNIWQMPPVFSAVKVSGQAAYKRARNGEKVTLGPRQVEINKIEILKYSFPKIQLRVTTGSGTYVRSLARDIGEELKTGGYLTALKRTRVGKRTIDKSVTLDEFERDQAARKTER